MISIADASDVAPFLTWVWVALATTLLTLLAAAIITELATPTADAPVAETTTSTATRCTVPFCGDPVQIHIHAGHDWWLFCMTHGLPYLLQPFERTEDAA